MALSSAMTTSPAAITPPGPSLTELAAGTGVSARTIRTWIKRGLLPPPEPHGPATRYTADHRRRVLAILKLRARNMRLPAIARHLAKASREELAALGADPTAALAQPAAVPPPPAAPAYVAESWEHIVLWPGLELHVRAGAGPVLRRIAQDIVTHYGAPRAPEA